MSLDSFFNEGKGAEQSTKTTPVESEWFVVWEHEVTTGCIAASEVKEFDCSREDGGVVEVPNGLYELALQGVAYGDDRRVARARILKKGAKETSRRETGEAWTDLAECGIYELPFLESAMEAHGDSFEDWLESMFDDGDFRTHRLRVFEKDERARAFVFRAGFGDGEFPVYALEQDGQPIGLEVEFIATGDEYPFDED